MASAISLLDSPTNPATAATAVTAKSKDLASKDAFLQLLVAQIKNQNPLSPSDGAQFVAQLAQFSSLEQSVSMRQDIASIKDVLNSRLPNATDTKTP